MLQQEITKNLFGTVHCPCWSCDWLFRARSCRLRGNM